MDTMGHGDTLYIGCRIEARLSAKFTRGNFGPSLTSFEDNFKLDCQNEIDV